MTRQAYDFLLKRSHLRGAVDVEVASYAWEKQDMDTVVEIIGRSEK